MAAGADDDDNDSTIKGLPFALPSINQILLAWLAFISGFRLVDSLPDLRAESSNHQHLNVVVALNALLCVGAVLGLTKSLEKVDYAALDGFDDNSLARQAGEWAVAGIVPTHYYYQDNDYEVATFAGGCFWGTELHFQRIPGVIATCVGYTQGSYVRQPTYEQVGSGSTGHTEAIQLLFDPRICSYERLLHKLFDTIDPTLLNRVGNDRGTQYRHGVYTHTERQAETAARLVQELQAARLSAPVVTEVRPAMLFWPAENYHQRYLERKGQSAAKDCQDKVRCYG
jgi:peptide-methionine (S)-S-oxide reductase